MTRISTALEALIEEEVTRRVAEATPGSRSPLKVADFAARAGLAAPTVYGLIRDGKIKTVDTGTRRVLIPAAELDRYLNAEGAA
jgi:excisionase family DNA binding protein